MTSKLVSLCTFLSLAAATAFAAEQNPGYVPKPVPVQSDLEIAAFYYPGTDQMAEWDMVETTLPNIKPLLGWYDEGNPEVIDWQIKWAVEHGIGTFFVDWYWDRGARRLEHWVQGFYRAKYRSYLKWAVMWANHDAPGSHSADDIVSVTKFWIDHYFSTPEYYRIDDKPVVLIWESEKLDSDFILEAAAKGETLAKGEGAKRALSLSNQIARDAGFQGIYFIEMFKRPYTKENLQASKDQGFRETTTYNYSHQAWWRCKDKDAKGTRNRFSYQCVEETVAESWKEQADAGVLPFIPILPTGWNDQPRSFQKATVIYGRTPELFRSICEQARDFCRQHGIKRIVLAPINEWQEGSYIEPNEEYGFAMYDAVRDVFCKKPEQGWPANVTPKQLGLGPYDYPPMVHPARTEWNFDASTEGWYRQPYGAGVLRVRDGCLHLDTTRDDRTKMRIKVAPFPASEYGSFVVRMRVRSADADGTETTKLYWGTDQNALVQNLVLQEDKTAALPVKADGAFHEYVFSLSDSATWKDRIVELWFDPISRKNAAVDIDWMKFSK
ncbi:MAG: hypothetical protein GXX96_32195 [Planctomycetaceae bacterium]|nr:hypothetical protein [Planctomycetaceae bacterium]